MWGESALRETSRRAPCIRRSQGEAGRRCQAGVAGARPLRRVEEEYGGVGCDNLLHVAQRPGPLSHGCERRALVQACLACRGRGRRSCSAGRRRGPYRSGVRCKIAPIEAYLMRAAQLQVCNWRQKRQRPLRRRLAPRASNCALHAAPGCSPGAAAATKKKTCCLANEVSKKYFIKVLCRCNPFFRCTACSAHLLLPRSGLSTPASFIVLSAKRSARPSGMQAQGCAPVVTHTVPRTTTVPSPLKGLMASRASRISIPSPAAERFQGCQESL